MIQIVYVNIDMYNKVLILLYYWSLPTTNNSALIPYKGLLIKVFPVQGRRLPIKMPHYLFFCTISLFRGNRFCFLSLGSSSLVYFIFI